MDFSISQGTRISVDNVAFAASNVTLPTQGLKLEVSNVAIARAICLLPNLIVTKINWESVILNLIDSQLILSTSTRAPPVRI